MKSTRDVRAVRRGLLRWYDEAGRDLPWRRTKDPYAIWVSEIMLQQTRVETVRGYWQRFLDRFPTTRSLAAASEDEVLAMWSGLGYYRRARLLHRGVKEVVATYGGEVPAEREARLALPGVGRYTAGALGSICFERPEPIVDGNVARVLSRLCRIETPLGAKATEARLWDEAQRLVVGPRPGDLNQALMELGATLCVPRSPRCDACPVAARCEARRAGVAAELPVPKAKKAPKEVCLAAVVATRGRAPEIWLRKSDTALFGGLWMVPVVEVERFASPQLSLLEGGAGPRREDAQRALREARLRGRLEATPRGQVEHVLSHRRLRVAVWRAGAATAREDAGLRPMDAAARTEVGVARLTEKILAAAGVGA